MKKMAGLGAVGAFCAAFTAPALGQAPRETGGAAPAHTYWEFDDAKIIVDIWRCPETKLCMRDHWVDPTDRKAQDVVKFMLKKDRLHGKFFQSVTPDDMRLICGYATPFHQMTELPPDNPDGGFHFRGISEYHALTDKPGMAGTLNPVDIADHNHHLTLTTDIVLNLPGHPVRHDIRHLHQVDDPPPACTPPSAKP